MQLGAKQVLHAQIWQKRNLWANWVIGLSILGEKAVPMFQGRRQLSKAAPQQQAPQGAEHDLHRVWHRRPLLLPQPAQDRHRGLRGQPDLVSPQVLYRTVLVGQMTMDYSFKCPELQFFHNFLLSQYEVCTQHKHAAQLFKCLNVIRWDCCSANIHPLKGKFCISSILEQFRLGANAL